MGKVTSKLQLTLPKAIADQFGIRPGDEMDWFPAGEVIRVVPSRIQKAKQRLSLEDRVNLFDRATQRQRRRDAVLRQPSARRRDRGWNREDLYHRGLSR